MLNLEDEMLRIKLVGKVADINEIVNGVVCAVLGHENKDTGTFEVRHYQCKVYITTMETLFQKLEL